MMLAPFIAWVRKKYILIALAVVGGVLGVLPDLLGLYGMIVRRSGQIYDSAHIGMLRDHLHYIPMYALHLGVDSLTHDPDRQWYGWNVRVWLQIVLWIVNIVVIVWFYRIWKRNQPGEHGITDGGGVPTDGTHPMEP